MTKGNYKIDVSALSTVERTKLQEELFRMGYRWFDVGKKVAELDKNFLLLYSDMDIAVSSSADHFNKQTHTLITPSDILHQPMETITLRDYFAGLAMVQLMQVHESEEAVGRAYLYADAMLKERNK